MTRKYFLALCCLVLAAAGTAFRQPDPDKKYCYDLTIAAISEPQWDREQKVTRVVVTVRNTGRSTSDTTVLQLADIDKEGYSDFLTSKSNIVQYGIKQKMEKVLRQEVLPLEPKEVREYDFTFRYWVFDPDCELEARIDPDSTLTECRENNNAKEWIKKGDHTGPTGNE